MSYEPGHNTAEAFLDEQTTLLGDYDLVQYITLQLTDCMDEVEPVETALTSHEARDLAYRLLVLAEYADRRSQGLS